MEQKPTALTVHPDAIPNELKAENQWVCWRYFKRGDKWTKPPITPGGKPAKRQ